MDYSKFIYQKAQSNEPQQSGVAPYLSGDQLPPDAIIVQRESIRKKSEPGEYNVPKAPQSNEEPAFVFRRVNQHGNLFSVPIGGPMGVNEAARQKIQELGLENNRFFFQMGHENRFIEATQRLVG